MLGHVVEILSGYAFDSNLFNTDGVGIPLVRIRDVGKDKSETFYNGNYSEDFILNNGDLLIGMDGDFRIAEWKGGKALLNQRVCKIIPLEKKIDRKYLLFALPKELKAIEDKTSFATVKHLSLKTIKSIKIPLPPLEEQKRIAAILDAADQHRQKTKELIAKYDALSQSLFLDIFGDPFENNKKFKVEILENLIKKVQIGPFGSQLHVSDYISGGVPIINPTHIGELKVNENHDFTISAEKFNELENYHLMENDVIMGRRGEMGRCALITSREENFLCGTGSLFIRPTKKLNSLFLVHLLSSSGGVSYLNHKAKGVTMKNLNKTIILKMKFGYPPISLQNKFATQIEEIEKQKAQAQESLKKAEDLFQSLLQKAFKGELSKGVLVAGA